MVSKYRSQEIVLFLLFGFIVSCANLPEAEVKNNSYDTISLESGDIVCRLGNGFFSSHFKKFSVHEKIYSHVGLIEVSNDSIFVYHAEASEFTGIGHVKREEIHNFLDEIKTFAFYRISCDKTIKNKIIANAAAYYKRKTSFDMDFDITDDEKVYCTELVANSINKAFEKEIITPKIKSKGHLFYGVDDIYLNKDFYLLFKMP